MSRYVDIEGDWVDEAIKTYSLGYYDDDEYAIPFEALDSAPTIKTKQIKYFDEDEKVWKIGEVIVSDSEKPNNSTISKMEQVEGCIDCTHYGDYEVCKGCDDDYNKFKSYYEPTDEPQTDKDFKVTYTCSFTDCDNFKNFGFGEKCVECKRKQSEAKYKDEPQTERSSE